MINIKTLIFAFLISTTAQAQVSIVNALPDIVVDNGLNRKIATSVLWRNDNSKDNKLNLTGAGALSYKRELWLAHFVSKGTYEQEGGEGTEAGFMEHARFRLALSELISPTVPTKSDRVVLYLEAFSQHEHDRYRALNARILSGAGPAVALVKQGSLGVLIGSACMVEYIDYTGRVKSELNGRWSNYLQLDIAPSERFSIEGVTFVQFKFNDFSDHLLMTTVALKVNATNWFGVKLSAGLDYDSNPPPGIKKVGTGVKSEIFVEF